MHGRVIVLKQSCFRHVGKSTILTNYDFYYTFVIDAIRCVVAHIHLADDSYHVAVKYVILTNYVNICDSCYRGFSISDNIQYRHV